MSCPTAFAGALALAVAGALAVSPSAQAEPRANSQTVVIRDLDLGTDAGARTLLTRIQKAARKVCDDERAGAQGIDLLWDRSCRKATVEKAVQTIGSTRLTSLHLRSRRALPVLMAQADIPR